MLTRYSLFFIALSIAYLISYADSVNDDYESSPADSTLHSNKQEDQTKHKKKDTTQNSEQSKKLTKKQKRKQRQEERKKYNDMTQSAHESMFIGSSTHKHGVTGKKVHKGNAPLKPQTFCPVMDGPIDKRFYADHDGVRVYFCCEGCIYQFKRTPSIYIKTLKRYGEKPEKIK